MADFAPAPQQVAPGGSATAPVGAFIKPDWAEADVWADLLRNRKAKRLTNTGTAYRKFLTDIIRARMGDGGTKDVEK